VAGAHLISRVIQEQIVEEEFSYHVTFSAGDVEIVEMTIGSGGTGSTVADFEVDGRLRVAAIRRDGRTIIPDDDFALSEDDLVVAAAKHGTSDKIGQYLAKNHAETS
jgi:Trk K+ transport system NAD-binding subunit